MSEPAETDSEHSITVQDRSSRRWVDVRPVPTLFMVGDAEGLKPPKQRIVTFEKGVYVGRRAPSSSEADVSLLLKDPLISGQHCLIVRETDGYKISDLGSRNGTVVDGNLVREPTKLREGAVIFAGAQIMVFRVVQQKDLEIIQAELRSPFGPLPSASPVCAAVTATLRKLGASNCEILLTGETGVGKEVYALAIHEISKRTGRFVPINCAALPRELVESELFGYVRGAHSQARDSKRGLIEEAEGGTLFLDEIGEMPPELQTKLLRFIQDREVVPLGGMRGRKLDVRILAATSRAGAPTASSSGLGLRPDLAARLGAEPIRLPPLRHRLEDLGTLAAHFLRDCPRRFEPAAFQALALYSWPGNIRELEKVLGNADLLSRDSEQITLEHLPESIGAGPERLKAAPPGPATRPPPPDRRALTELLERNNGNVLRVARDLERKPALIYRWCKRFGLDPDKFRRGD